VPHYSKRRKKSFKDLPSTKYQVLQVRNGEKPKVILLLWAYSARLGNTVNQQLLGQHRWWRISGTLPGQMRAKPSINGWMVVLQNEKAQLKKKNRYSENT